MAITSPAPDTPLITIVHAPACHFCDDARLRLSELAHEFPLSLEFIECGAARGQTLVREHRAAMFPLVLVDGAYFSSGRLPERKLRKRLAPRASTVVA